MLEKSILFLVKIAIFFIVLCFERVVGIPLLSIILFYAFVLQQTTYLKVLPFIVVTLVLAALYLVPPVFVGTVLLVGFVSLLFSTNRSGNMSTRVWYSAFAAAVVIGGISKLTLSLQVIIFTILQLSVGYFVIKRFMFKDVATKLQWQQKTFSGDVYEKTI